MSPRRWSTPVTALLLLSVLAGCSGGSGGRADGATDRPTGATAAPSSAPPSSGASPGRTPDRAPHRTSGGGASTPARPSTGPGPSATRPTGTPVRTRWRPRPGLAWQWQLDGKVDPSVDVPVYDIDGFENSAADVARLHRDGRRVICYINVGAWEDYRPDRDAFPRSLLGGPNGWHGERWLDIRRVDLLRPLMERRFDMCRDKGFDAVEPDLMEGYNSDTGFPLTADDQLRYNRMIAEIAHERGLAVGLKNDLAQIPRLVKHFDFAVNEECAQFEECALLTPFVAAGKAVFHVEYTEPKAAFCPQARALRLSSMRKKLELDVWRSPC
ncbi:endo alpha-1,4 polygalactosaminidase [Streptomyces sp. Qhu_M48]|uniref:endo alpha-1,4 polygalactosaminidase n=1 Tax=Streptomyces sp. Qhu_M48 TaxID=3435889 RepID=UPI003F4F9B67